MGCVLVLCGSSLFEQSNKDFGPNAPVNNDSARRP
jgi:hypothetical protein